MKKVVVDASVAIKWFIPEVHSAAAVRFLDPAFTLIAPDLIASEFANAIWKKVRRRELDRDEAREIGFAFAKVPLEICASLPILPAALELAIGVGRSVYDSLYLALAVAEDCRVVTADAKLYASIAASAVASHVHWVEDDL